jgi:hypothetical protein
MHPEPVHAHPPDGRVVVPLAPVPKLFMKAGHCAGEPGCAGLGQAKIEDVVVRSAKACPLSAFVGVIAQPVRDNEKPPPIKRHPESRSQTRAHRPTVGNCLTTTPRQKMLRPVLDPLQNPLAIAQLP